MGTAGVRSESSRGSRGWGGNRGCRNCHWQGICCDPLQIGQRSETSSFTRSSRYVKYFHGIHVGHQRTGWVGGWRALGGRVEGSPFLQVSS